MVTRKKRTMATSAARRKPTARSATGTPPARSASHPPSVQATPRSAKTPKPQWSGSTDMSARVAAADVLEALRSAMFAEQTGVEAGKDPEYLHRYRVGLRRTRTLLAQMRRELPGRRVSALYDELLWLAEITTHVRDMDVYLDHWPDYRQNVPAVRRKDLTPLHTYLQTRRERLQSILRRALRSDRYGALMRAWTDLESRLRERPGKKSRTLGRIAGKRFARLRQRILDEAAELNEHSPPLQLHELRKTCKKFRYMLEFSRTLLPDQEVRQLLLHLKDLQDALGGMHDLYVHHAALSECAQALGEDVSVKSHQAIAELLDHLAKKRHGAFAPVEKKLRAFTALLAAPEVAKLLAFKPQLEVPIASR